MSAKCHLADTVELVKCHLTDSVELVKCHLADTVELVKCHLADTVELARCHRNNINKSYLEGQQCVCRFFKLVKGCCAVAGVCA